MKRINKLIIIMLLIQLAVLIIPNKNIAASANLVVLKTSSGSELTYRNSSEKVYRLAEYNYPTSQLRACWVSNFAGDLPAYQSESQYKSTITTLLNNMESMGMNAVIFHIRTHNNALYKSKLNGLANWWSEVNFDVFDPLEWTIAECHRRGIEFHAWLNPYRVSNNGTNKSNISGDIPEGNPANNWDNLIKAGSGVILDPGIPENRDFIVDTCMEVVENYDVDAIHFDDYFYISGADDTTTRTKYNTENLSIANFRRKQVDLFIEDLSNHLRKYNQENNKCVQLGISPSNVYQNGSYSNGPKYDANGNMTSPLGSNTAGFAHYGDYLYSDTLNWINHEWIDYIMPQAYHSLEQAAASYAEIVRWWSWAVRYKKVNLYTGIGIYMVFENNEYWKRNVNEVELELLVAGQYPEFKGAVFYKYSNLTRTDNATVAHAVNTISNDFWKKRIPAAVLPYYAPITPEVKVTNVQYDSSNKTLTWSPLEKVRGYIVYQVPKGQTLDKNNINHILEYTQDTSVVLTDVQNYQYYVASVNLANETSEVEFVNINLKAQDIILLIDKLPDQISYSDIDSVRYARTMYEKLSNEEKAKVTNLDKLIRLENSLENYDILEAYLDAYINGLDKHIKTNRILPTPQNVTLSYKNAADQNLYNITTGVRLKEYLATKEITLIATMTENNISVSKEFNVNIGYTGTDQIGLFYRNDPSAMGKDDDGAYGVNSSKYIGWGGHTFVIQNYVLFISNKNYHEITDSTNITKCQHISVAGVYVNKTASTISMKLSSAFENKSCDNDGYFILANDKIKVVSHGFNPDETIKLEPTETLIIVRYLDNELIGKPLTPVTKFSVGTKAYIDEEKEATAEDFAKIIMGKIDAIQTPITLEQEELIVNIREEYNNLPKEVQDLVTNYDKLMDYLGELSNLKAEIKAIRFNSIQSLNDYVKLEEYSQKNQEQIKLIIEEASDLINQSISKEEIASIVKNYKEKLSKIETIIDELAPYKQEKLEELNRINYQLYNEEGQTAIHSIVDNTTVKVNNETSKDAIDQLIMGALQEISKIKTISQLEEELNVYKEEQIHHLQTYLDKTLYNELEISHINTIISHATDEINSSKTKDAIDLIVSRAKNELDELPTSGVVLQTEKNKYLQKIDELNQSYENLAENYKNQIQKICNDAKEQINKATTIDEVRMYYQQTQTNINTYFENLENAKNEAEKEINTLVDSLNCVDKEKVEIDKEITSLVTSMKNMATVEEIVELKEQCINKITNYHNNLMSSKSKALDEMRGLILSTYSKGQIKYLNQFLQNQESKINECGTIEEVVMVQKELTDNINEYIVKTSSKLKLIEDYLNDVDIDSEFVSGLVEEAKTALNEASSIEEMNKVRVDFEKKLNDYLASRPEPSKPVDNGNNCNCASLIYSFIFVIASCIVILIRKNAHR